MLVEISIQAVLVFGDEDRLIVLVLQPLGKRAPPPLHTGAVGFQETGEPFGLSLRAGDLRHIGFVQYFTSAVVVKKGWSSGVEKNRILGFLLMIAGTANIWRGGKEADLRRWNLG